MRIIVTYQSKTGFTKKYAEWIAQELSCESMELAKVSADQVAGYDLVIHGGWIMGGMVNGLEKMKAMNPKHLVVFAVGFTEKEKVDISTCVETNKLGDTPFFYYEGGMNPKKMGLIGRTMVKMVTKKKPEYADHTDSKEIKELVNMVHEVKE